MHPNRDLPQVEKLVSNPGLKAWDKKIIKKVRVRLAQGLISDVRQGRLVVSNFEEQLSLRYEKLVEPGLRKVINASGVLLHTNLGRARVSREILELLPREMDGYCNLEFNTQTGNRGSRTGKSEQFLQLLTGAEAALIVNNNAAALFLMLHVFAKSRKVIVSRGELVQIGGGFRIPEILNSAGCELIEVGTTNMTSLKDYTAPLDSSVAAILKVHQSNFGIVGHTQAASVTDLSKLKVPLFCDLGSGALFDLGIDEPTVSDWLQEGATLVCFSGDKLLGGPQAGIVVGSKEPIEKLRVSPLYRALRLGKFELFILEKTLLALVQGGKNSLQQQMESSSSELEKRAVEFAQALKAELGEGVRALEGRATIGGGTTPLSQLPTYCVEITPKKPELFFQKLLEGQPAVVVHRDNKKAVIDFRTVNIDEERIVFQRIVEAWLACSC